MFTLFPDQIEIENLVLSYFAQSLRRVLMVSPTGSGKTVTFCDIVSKAIAKGKRVLVLCHRDELITSAKEKLNEFGIFPHLIIAKSIDNPAALCSVASVSTLRKRNLLTYDLVVIDEAHRCDFDKIIDQLVSLCNPYILGVTASPVRTGAQRCLSTIYEAMAEVATIKQLISNKRLTRARHFSPKKDFSKIKITGNDYDLHAISDAFNKAEMYDGMIDKYREFAEGTKTIIFNSNVENSLITRDKFREEGYECEHIDGNTPGWKRRDILKDLKHKPNFIVTNCDILTTGFDEKTLTTVLVNRATLSLALWLQMCGRGARALEGKEHFNIVDMGANAWRHLPWHFDRKWSLKKKPKGKSDGVTGLKVCKACQALNSSSARKCCECGTELTNPVEKMLKNGEFMEITSEMERGVEAYFDKSKASFKELHKYAKQKGYSPGWAKVQYDLQQKAKEAEPFSRGAK